VTEGQGGFHRLEPEGKEGGWPEREGSLWASPEGTSFPEPELEAAPVAGLGEAQPVSPLGSGLPLEVVEAPAPVEGAPGEERSLAEHAPGGLRVPDGYDLIEGGPHGFRRTVAVVVSRFNGDITSRLLDSALQALADCHVAKEQISIVPVPGAFELPLAALALAKTRRFSCVVALGCVIRGETPHFDYVAGEAASGLQLAAIESGIPVSFGVLTCETREQAEARVSRGADAARTALEMADLFAHIRTRAASAR